MPRDGTATKDGLLREAQRLFARRGVDGVTGREIVDAAGQRNASALTYHFGSRGGVLDAILNRYGEPTDALRGELLAAVGHDASTRALVDALVVPYTAHLATDEGRDYLRIVSQLSARFASWRAANPGTGPHLREILTVLEARPPAVAPEIRRERVVEMIMLMTAATAERARLVDSGGSPELDHAAFVANLTDVLVGVLEAPVGVTTLP